MIWWMLQNFIVTAVLAGCVWAACRIGRIGPVGQHALWLVLLLKLLTPPLVLWPWAVHDLLPFSQLETPPVPDSPPAYSRPAVAAPGPVLVGRQALEARPEVSSQTVTARPSPPSPPPFQDLLSPALASVWFCGGAIFILVQGERIRRMLRLLRTSIPAGPGLTSLVSEVAGRLKTRAVKTRIAAGIASPFIWCIHRPQLLWPAALSTDIPEESVRGLLVHELAHLKRRDHWVGWLELAAGILWWWNPLYWYIRHQLRENAELACDAWVVDAMDSCPKGRRDYAEALLTVCESVSGDPKRSNPMPAVGVASGNRRFLERRLTMILRERLPLRLSRAGILVIALIAAIALPVWSLKAAPARVVRAIQAAQQAARPRTPAPAAAPVPQGLPGDAQELLKQYEARQAEVRRTTEATIEQQRRQLIEQLQALQDTHTKAGRLDEALAVRDQVRRLQGIATPVDDRTQASLDRKLPQISFTNTPLRKALDDLRDMANANIYVPWKVLSSAGVDENTPINLKVRDVSLSRALSLVLTDATGDNRLTYDIDGGVIEITTAEAVAMRSNEQFFGWNGGRDAVSFPWSDLTFYRDQVGQTVRVPVTGATDGAVWGTDVYTDDSDPNVAAVHAGLLQPGQTGIATIRIMPGQTRYSASARNGVRTDSFASFGGSYRFERVDPVGKNQLFGGVQGFTGLRPGELWAGDSLSRVDLPGGGFSWFKFESPTGEVMERRGRNGESFELEVTGLNGGTIWGDGVYTDDSPVGTAAVHAGILKIGETGKVRVTILPGRNSYPGSLRNGVRSEPFDQWEGSYRMEPVK